MHTFRQPESSIQIDHGINVFKMDLFQYKFDVTKWVFNILLPTKTANEEEKIKKGLKMLICCLFLDWTKQQGNQAKQTNALYFRSTRGI